MGYLGDHPIREPDPVQEAIHGQECKDMKAPGCGRVLETAGTKRGGERSLTVTGEESPSRRIASLPRGQQDREQR